MKPKIHYNAGPPPTGCEANKRVFQPVVWEIAEHLRTQFGHYVGCLQCCGVPLPPEGAVFEVLDALETCHPSSGRGLEDQCVPPGIYRMVSADSGNTSHFIQIERIATGEVLHFNAGYRLESVVDWRGVLAVTDLQ